MLNLRNKVQLIGNLGMDPEIKKLESGKKMAKMAIATTETYRNLKGEKVQDTQWHNVIAWGSSAEYAEKYLRKGLEIVVEGKLVNRSWEDKSGVKRYITEIIVGDLMITKNNKKQ